MVGMPYYTLNKSRPLMKCTHDPQPPKSQELWQICKKIQKILCSKGLINYVSFCVQGDKNQMWLATSGASISKQWGSDFMTKHHVCGFQMSHFNYAVREQTLLPPIGCFGHEKQPVNQIACHLTMNVKRTMIG